MPSDSKTYILPSPKSDGLTVKCAIKIFIVIFGGLRSVPERSEW